MKEEINFELIAKQYKCAVAAKYRPLKPEEISLIPSGKIFVSKKIDGELWLAHVNQNGATLFSKGGRFIKEGIKLISSGFSGLYFAATAHLYCFAIDSKFISSFINLSFCKT